MGVLGWFSPHFNARLAFSVSLVAVSAANYGFDNQGFGTTLAMGPFLEQFGVPGPKGTFVLQAYWLSLYSSLVWVGFAVGVVAGSAISARWGRRVGMLSLSIWAIISTTVLVSSFSKWQLLMGRFLFNGYMGMELSVLPVYQGEVVPRQVRGLIGSTYQFAIQIGGLIMNLICLGTQTIPNNKSWRIPLGLFYIVPSIVIAGLHWVPESPRWLLAHDRREEALTNLRLLRKGKRTEEEIALELETIEVALREEPEQGKFLEIFKKENIRRTAIACGINFAQEMSGQQITAKFGAYIVLYVGTISPFIMTVIFSVTSIVIVATVMATVDHVGRRPYLLISIFVMCASAFSLGAIGCYNYTVITALGRAAIFFLVMNSAGFALGYGPLTNVVMVEVVSLRLRDMTQRSAGFCRVIANVIVGATLPYLIDDIELKLGFVFGCICFFAFIFTYLVIPECKGKSLELIDIMFHEGIPSRKFGSYKGDLQHFTEETVAGEEKKYGEKVGLGENEPAHVISEGV